MHKYTISFVLASASLIAGEYGFSTYHYVDPDRPIHVEGRYRWVGPAKFENHKRGHVDYSDANAGLYYTQFLNDENSLSYEVGYDFLRFDWKKNPRFSDKDFHYFVGSLGLASTTIDRWRWVLNAGFSVDAAHFDFAHSAVGHAMMWGRFHAADWMGVHVGIFGWYGVENGQAWPIFGFDWKFNDHWSAATVFPQDVSLTYSFNENWSIEAASNCFGGPYRNYPRRARDGKQDRKREFKSPVFMIFSSGAELCLRYKFEHLLRANIGAGWDFGGWIFIADHDNRHGKYYHFNGAPYLKGGFELTF